MLDRSYPINFDENGINADDFIQICSDPLPQHYLDKCAVLAKVINRLKGNNSNIDGATIDSHLKKMLDVPHHLAASEPGFNDLFKSFGVPDDQAQRFLEDRGAPSDVSLWCYLSNPAVLVKAAGATASSESARQNAKTAIATGVRGCPVACECESQKGARQFANQLNVEFRQRMQTFATSTFATKNVYDPKFWRNVRSVVLQDEYMNRLSKQTDMTLSKKAEILSDGRREFQKILLVMDTMMYLCGQVIAERDDRAAVQWAEFLLRLLDDVDEKHLISWFEKNIIIKLINS